jgi:hypothetical protein
MARKKQLRFTADPDVEKVIKKYVIEHPDVSLSKVINLIIRRGK